MNSCTKCLAALAFCTCAGFAVEIPVTASSDAVTCGQQASIVGPIWCDFSAIDLPHDEPGEPPGPPRANLTVTVSTGSAPNVSSSFTLTGPDPED